MRTIFKFPLNGFGRQRIVTPYYLTPLSVGWQQNDVVLWADCIKTTQVFAYWLDVFGTGWEIPEDYTGNFIGTVQGTSGYVYHVFIQQLEAVLQGATEAC